MSGDGHPPAARSLRERSGCRLLHPSTHRLLQRQRAGCFALVPVAVCRPLNRGLNHLNPPVCCSLSW